MFSFLVKMPGTDWPANLQHQLCVVFLAFIAPLCLNFVSKDFKAFQVLNWTRKRFLPRLYSFQVLLYSCFSICRISVLAPNNTFFAHRQHTSAKKQIVIFLTNILYLPFIFFSCFCTPSLLRLTFYNFSIPQSTI